MNDLREVDQEFGGNNGGDPGQNSTPPFISPDPLSINSTVSLPASERDAARSPRRGNTQTDNQPTEQRNVETPREDKGFFGNLWDTAVGLVTKTFDLHVQALKAIGQFLYAAGELLGINGFLRFGYNGIMGICYKIAGNEEKAKEHFSKLTFEDALDFALGLVAIFTFGAGLAARSAIKGATIAIKAVGNEVSKEIFEQLAKKITREAIEKAVVQEEKKAAEAVVKKLEEIALKEGKLPTTEQIDKILQGSLKPVMDKIDNQILKALDKDAINAFDKSFEKILQAGKNSDIYKTIRASTKSDAEATKLLDNLKTVIKGDYSGLNGPQFKFLKDHYRKLGDKALKDAFTDPSNPGSLLSLLRNHLLENGAGETFEKTLRDGIKNSSALKEAALKQGKNFDEWTEEVVTQGKKKYSDELDKILKKRIEKWVDEALKRVRGRRFRPHLKDEDEDAKKVGNETTKTRRHDSLDTKTTKHEEHVETQALGGKKVQQQVTTGSGSNVTTKGASNEAKSSIFVQHGNLHGIKMEGDLGNNSVYSTKSGTTNTANEGLPHQLAESLGTKETETKTVGGVIDISSEVIKSSRTTTTSGTGNAVDIGTVLKNVAGSTDKAA